MTFLSHSLLGDPMMLVVLQATAIMGFSILVGAIFSNAAAVKSCIYMTAVVCTFIAPTALLLCSSMGYTIEVPLPLDVLGNRNDRSKGIAAYDLQTELEESLLGTDSARDNQSSRNVAASEEVGDVEQPRFSRRFSLIGLWVLGSLLYGIGIVMSLVRIRKILRTIKSSDLAVIHSAARRAATNLGITEFPRIGLTNRVASPVAAGIPGNMWVLLPKNCLNAMSEDQLTQVLTHEGAHVIRRDPLIRLLQRVHLALWWWNPIAHRLHCGLSQAREEVCDNFVLEQSDGVVYGTTLLELGKLISSDEHLVGSVSLFGSRWSLEHRIKGFLNPRRRIMVQVSRTVFASVFAAFVGITMLTSVTRVEAQESREREMAERRAKLQRFEHLVAAHQHLKETGFEELANMVGERVTKMANSFPDAAGSQVALIRRRVADRMPETRDRAVRIREEIRRDRDLVRNRDRERVRDRGNEFQDDVRGALLQLTEAMEKLRKDVDRLQERQERRRGSQ